HDALGRKVRTLEEGHKTAGQYQYILNAGSLPSGVYLYRLEAGDFVESKRMVLSK
ncbi:MAG: T9SS type A sorting domain-containing protein, partial [Bacteroidetes bacterium]|nr:T9SS type A sorting domain-containing protein [Bacteroidota bacterium]